MLIEMGVREVKIPLRQRERERNFYLLMSSFLVFFPGFLFIREVKVSIRQRQRVRRSESDEPFIFFVYKNVSKTTAI